MLNHPAVYINLAGPPFPYTQAHYDARFKKSLREVEMTEAEFREAEIFRVEPNGRKWVGGVPLTEISVSRGADSLSLKTKRIGKR